MKTIRGNALFWITLLLVSNFAVTAQQPQLVVQTGYAGQVRSAAFSPDRKMIASGGDDHTFRLWDAVSGTLRSLRGPAESPTSQAQGADGITEANWRQNPKIKAIQKIVSSVNAGLKKGTFKTAQRKFQCEEVPYFTLKRIARDSQGAVAWYQEYSEGEDSSWDYQQYYDDARRLRFALILVSAANGSREQHRFYFDETGKLIWQSRKTLKGPGYFAPNNVEELPKEDPAKEFENAPTEGCTEIKSKNRPTVATYWAPFILIGSWK